MNTQEFLYWVLGGLCGYALVVVVLIALAFVHGRSPSRKNPQ